jgi:N-dimethylarginine dimethylaminohydrolase
MLWSEPVSTNSIIHQVDAKSKSGSEKKGEVMTEMRQLHQSAAYGSEGGAPRTTRLSEELGGIWAACGQNSEYAPLKRVLLHPPFCDTSTEESDPDQFQLLAPVDARRAAKQHADMAKAYTGADVTVEWIEPQGTPASFNLMFAADLFFMTPEGAILARPASVVRAGEERDAAACLARLGVPILRSVSGGGSFEGADAMWLDPQTVLLARGVRTNTEGIRQVSDVLAEMGVATIVVDLPHGTIHLMGILRIVDRDLAVAWPKRLAHHAVEQLYERGFKVAFIPEEAEAVGGAALNFVTVAPRHILMPAGNPLTQEFYEFLGITCHSVAVDEIVKAAGAIGCLTGVLERKLV